VGVEGGEVGEGQGQGGAQAADSVGVGVFGGAGLQGFDLTHREPGGLGQLGLGETLGGTGGAEVESNFHDSIIADGKLKRRPAKGAALVHSWRQVGERKTRVTERRRSWSFCKTKTGWEC
jgi:hypothetical protein